MKNLVLLATVALLAVGCNNGRRVMIDAGPTPGVDSGPVVVTDSGPVVGRDSGPTGSDPCATAMATAVSTVGCNGGFLSGEPAANGPNGACTGGGDAMPAGTCTTPNAACVGAMGIATAGETGECIVLCTSGGMYVTRGGCPTGYRCFDLSMNDICFRDCDATHACPAAFMCDGEGSCVPM